MKYNLCLILLALCVCASAQSPYRGVIESVVDRNGELAASSRSIEATHADAQAENSIEGPELEFERLWAANSSADNKWSAGITQEFAMPWLYRARSQAADASADAARLVLLGVKADKALSAKQLIIDIINVNQRLDFYHTAGENLRRIAELTERSYDRGNVTVLDMRKMKIAVLDNDRLKAGCVADRDKLIASLHGLGAEFNTDDAANWRDYPAQLCEAPSRESDGLLYAIEQAQGKASLAAAKAVKMQSWPTIALSYRHAFEEGTHFNGLSVSLRLPSFSQSKRRRAAALEAEATALEAKSRIISETSENMGLYNSANSLSKVIEGYRELSGDNTYLELLLKAFNGGELNVIDYLNEMNLFTEARLLYIDLQYRRNLDLARLNRYRSLDF